VGNDGVSKWDYLGMSFASAYAKWLGLDDWSINTYVSATVSDCESFDETSVRSDILIENMLYDISTLNSTLRKYDLGECCECYEFYTKQEAEFRLGIGSISLSATDVYIESRLTICTNGFASSEITITDEAQTLNHDGFSASIYGTKWDVYLSADGVPNSSHRKTYLSDPIEDEAIKPDPGICDCDKKP
jgi:hypothetical protein